MKKIFSLACAVLLAVSAQAQLVTSRSRSMIDTPKEDRTMWVLRVGIGTNKVVGDDYDYDGLGSKFGYTFSIEFNRSMGHRGAYWGMDWGLNSRGYKESDDDINYEAKLKAHNVNWSPFIFGWKIQIPDTKFSIDPHIGAFLSYDFAGKYVVESNGDSENWGIYDDEDIWGNPQDYWGLDVGMRVGVGVWYNNRYNLDLMYQRGFFAPDNSDWDGGASNFMVRLGIGF